MSHDERSNPKKRQRPDSSSEDLQPTKVNDSGEILRDSPPNSPGRSNSVPSIEIWDPIAPALKRIKPNESTLDKVNQQPSVPSFTQEYIVFRKHLDYDDYSDNEEMDSRVDSDEISIIGIYSTRAIAEHVARVCMEAEVNYQLGTNQWVTHNMNVIHKKFGNPPYISKRHGFNLYEEIIKVDPVALPSEERPAEVVVLDSETMDLPLRLRNSFSKLVVWSDEYKHHWKVVKKLFHMCCGPKSYKRCSNRVTEYFVNGPMRVDGLLVTISSIGLKVATKIPM
jgi:hypothetical protein